jgi:cationic peptide transport system permease protein
VSSIALQDYAAIRGATLVVASFVIFISVSTDLLTTIMYPARRKELYANKTERAHGMTRSQESYARQD